MEAVSQPGEQAGFRGGEVDARHADLGESELARPAADLRQQERKVALSNVDSHAAIVGTPGLELSWDSEDDTRAFAQRLAAHPAAADAFIALEGDLGAGKTTFVRHLLRALGVEGRIKSPTYAVVEPYELAGGPVWHFDFYRFDDPREWEDAGFRDIFAGPGLKIAEWPRKAAAVLPTADLVMQIALDEGERRRVQVFAQTARGRELLA